MTTPKEAIQKRHWLKRGGWGMAIYYTTKSMLAMIRKNHQTQANISSSRSALIVTITANGGGRLRIMDFFGEESSLHRGLNDDASKQSSNIIAIPLADLEHFLELAYESMKCMSGYLPLLQASQQYKLVQYRHSN
ncbi:hypothetical protein BDD12DRAFT_398185 [Trichophaea hybrida]|nr:hypothetical protein BDD12DRAFT_398185 [Trichophaea hybrida]